MIYPDAFEIHGSFSCSDHYPIILSMFMQRNNHKAFPFRFQNYWCHYQQLDIIVKKIFRNDIQWVKDVSIFQEIKEYQTRSKGLVKETMWEHS